MIITIRIKTLLPISCVTLSQSLPLHGHLSSHLQTIIPTMWSSSDKFMVLCRYLASNHLLPQSSWCHFGALTIPAEPSPTALPKKGATPPCSWDKVT